MRITRAVPTYHTLALVATQSHSACALTCVLQNLLPLVYILKSDNTSSSRRIGNILYPCLRNITGHVKRESVGSLPNTPHPIDLRQNPDFKVLTKPEGNAIIYLSSTRLRTISSVG